MHKRLVLSLAVILLAAMPHHARTQTTTDSLSQNQGQQGQATDCSDPANAMSAACSSANQGAYGLGSNLQTGESNVPAGSPLTMRTYTDLGIGATGTTAATQQRTGLVPSTVSAPPEPLTEFQKFVAGTTGEVLPIFGADLFRYVPTTFTPLEQIPVTPNYIIGPGDVLRIRVWGQINFNADVRVDRTGSIYLPQVGTIHVGFAVFCSGPASAL